LWSGHRVVRADCVGWCASPRNLIATRGGCMKKLNPWCLAAIASVAPLGALGGMMGALAGHTAVLAITMGIFVGTLSLNRTPVNQGSTIEAPSVGMLDEREASRRRSLPG